MMATMNNDGGNRYSLPDGWEWKTVGEIGEVKGGKRLPAGHAYSDEPTNFPYIRVKDFENGTVNTSGLKYLLPETQEQIKRYIISRKDVYISIAGTIGVTGVIPEIIDGANLTENAAKICNLNSVLPKYLHYYLTSSSAQTIISEKTISTNQPKLALFRIEQIPVPLAPLPEQEKIVSRIEELLSDLDAGMVALERVRTGLKRYKTSVLKATLEGKLFAGKEAGRNSAELPEGWRRVTLAEITSQIKDADHKMPKPAESNIPYVSTKDFIDDEDIDFENAKHISEEDYKLLTRKIKPEIGDILLSRYGTIGQIRKVKTDRPFQASYSIAIIKPLASEVLTDFLVTLLRSEVGQKQMRDNIRASSQPDLGLESIRKFVFPLPPLDEQRRIVAEVERRLSVVGEVESAVDVGLVRAGRLRQSVLRSAFEGRL